MKTLIPTRSISELISYVTSECTAIDREERFDSMLDECYSFEKIGGPFEYMVPSQVLKECDPTAYRCGVNDWADGEDWFEIESDYYETRDVEKARDEFVEMLNDEVTELESDIESEKEEDEPDSMEIERMENRLVELQAFVAECEKYVF